MFDDVLEHCLQPVLCNYLLVIGYLSVEYAVYKHLFKQYTLLSLSF